MKKLTVASSVLAITMSLGSAAFACGDGSCDPVKGNNGWGNGADTTNNGSDDGKTSVTKSVNGPANDKFSGR
ncbi:hypothetical protein [Rhodobacter sp. SY28-1]|uniref:hypothetical protein n=1 Tax=Rhodobacter sp. SY28-1 TaxID=2562317 RepID=UPI0010C0B638|nr:hypothetical protein [Rhodobacter sp. SY28-1]